jgi:hypothetical protein
MQQEQQHAQLEIEESELLVEESAMTLEELASSWKRSGWTAECRNRAATGAQQNPRCRTPVA